MKNYRFLTLAAIIAVTLTSSCKKEVMEINSNPKQPQYAEAIAGSFIPIDGDITMLKSAPAVGGHQINCYDKKVGQSNWSVIDGNEFPSGSVQALDWSGYAIDGPAWWFSGGVYITYCPVLPMKVVLKATEGGYGTTPSYLGIWEGTPSMASFPISVQDRRLGDVLKLNTDALTSLPGYAMSFDVVYTKSVIDVNGTALTSPATTTDWPVYEYSSNSEVTTTLNSTQHGDQVIYEGLDSKITGTITINIHIDSKTITKTTSAVGPGHGLIITLKTNKVGSYDSGTIGVTENDIVIDAVEIVVE